MTKMHVYTRTDVPPVPSIWKTPSEILGSRTPMFRKPKDEEPVRMDGGRTSELPGLLSQLLLGLVAVSLLNAGRG